MTISWGRKVGWCWLALLAGAACSGDLKASTARKPASSRKAKDAVAPDGGHDSGAFANAGSFDAGPVPKLIDAAAAVFMQNSCGFGCTEDRTGQGTNQPFDPKHNPSERVGLDADGALVIERDTTPSPRLIWIANTREGTVSKIDTTARVELGRYAVPVNSQKNGDANGPSRTSVDSDGNVYAGDRYGDNLTKISAAGDACPDTDGDGKVTTSDGPGNVLAYGKDDCVLWSTGVEGDARAVAVQETPTRYTIESVPDHAPTVTEVPGTRAVWVGGYDVAKLHKVDAETGKILFTLDPAPTAVYGLAVDGRGYLWISGKKQNSLARVDTTRCSDKSCNDEQVCVSTCNAQSCPDTCDQAVLARIDFGDNSNPYGITVDCAQRVWMGGAWGGNGVMRYDPLAPADKRFARIDDAAFNAVSPKAFDDSDLGIHGIAADASGWVWGAGHDTGVWRIDAESLKFTQVMGTGGPDYNAKGIAVDRDGKVWAIPLRKEYALVITPGATLDDATVEKPIHGLGGPYTYSDMTGEQRRLAANEPGSYRQTFEGCKPGGKPTEWGDLSFEADLPKGTLIVLSVRSADTAADLANAAFVQVAALPGSDSPVDLKPFTADSTHTPGRYLEVEVRLLTTAPAQETKDRCSSIPMVTPRLKRLSVKHICASGLG